MGVRKGVDIEIPDRAHVSKIWHISENIPDRDRREKPGKRKSEKHYSRRRPLGKKAQNIKRVNSSHYSLSQLVCFVSHMLFGPTVTLIFLKASLAR